MNGPTKFVVVGILGIAAFATVVIGDQVAEKHFNPPRTAVVDTFEVIENYAGKQELERKLKGEFDDANEQLADLERQFAQIEQELKIVDEGTPEHRERVLDRTRLGLQLKDMKKKFGAQLFRRRDEAIESIRKKVEAELATYASSHGIDLVVEKRIPIEGREGAKINIPIIRYVTPEIDITKEIAVILNERYKAGLRSPQVKKSNP